jgi:hypothetical protein
MEITDTKARNFQYLLLVRSNFAYVPTVKDIENDENVQRRATIYSSKMFKSI